MQKQYQSNGNNGHLKLVQDINLYWEDFTQYNIENPATYKKKENQLQGITITNAVRGK